MLRTVKPPLSLATTSAPATASQLSAKAKPTSWSGSAGPNWAVISIGMPSRPRAFRK